MSAAHAGWTLFAGSWLCMTSAAGSARAAKPVSAIETDS